MGTTTWTDADEAQSRVFLQERQVVWVRCCFCWAPPGEWCRTASGHTSTWLHKRRWSAWRASVEAKRSSDTPSDLDG